MNPVDKFESEADRAQYLEDVLTVLYGNENVDNVYLWGIQEKTHWRGKEGAGMYDENFDPNDAGRVLEKVQDEWSTDITVTTDDEGKAILTGAPGIYKVTNTGSGKSRPAEISK